VYSTNRVDFEDIAERSRLTPERVEALPWPAGRQPQERQPDRGAFGVESTRSVGGAQHGSRNSATIGLIEGNF